MCSTEEKQMTKTFLSEKNAIAFAAQVGGTVEQGNFSFHGMMAEGFKVTY
jgi:hypothetical protein